MKKKLTMAKVAKAVGDKELSKAIIRTIGSKKKEAQEEAPEESERPSEAGNPTNWTGWKEKHPSSEMSAGFVSVDTIEPGTAVETESGTAFTVLEKGSMAVKVEVDDASGNFVTWIENNVPVKLLFEKSKPKRRREK